MSQATDEQDERPGRPEPHRFRGFLKEYLIIVVGVLTALAGEQIVQWAHRQSEVAEARQAVRAEIANNVRVALLTLEHDRCRVPGLTPFAAWAEGGQKPPIGPRAPVLRPASNSWEIVKTGVASEMPLKERLAYAQFYDRMEVAASNTMVKRDFYLELVGYQQAAALTPAHAHQLLRTIARIRTIIGVETVQVQGSLDVAKVLGIEPAQISAEDRGTLDELCKWVGLKPNLPPEQGVVR